MSKHKMVDGRLLQMNKSFGQLKQKQREKIAEWMFQAYKKQVKEGLSEEDALQLVFDQIEEAQIWIPDYEIVNRYHAKKSHFRNRLVGENVPQHVYRMENILDNAIQKMDALEKKIEEYEAFQAEIQKLEAYYTSPQWKADFAADEAGEFSDKLKRGVLSEDGIWNMLERNRELLERIGIRRTDEEGDCLWLSQLICTIQEKAEVHVNLRRRWNPPGLLQRSAQRPEIKAS